MFLSDWMPESQISNLASYDIRSGLHTIVSGYCAPSQPLVSEDQKTIFYNQKHTFYVILMVIYYNTAIRG